MKNIKIIVILAHLLIGTLTFAQAPEKMSYQAVVRNTTNNLVTNQAVGMQISILQGSASGTAVYVETQTPTSNANGLVSLEIGGGTVVSGNMATINWANGPYFIKTETDPTGGSSYTITGTSQLLSTPYALYAKTAGDSWNKTGNSGTVEGTNFIGNSDNKALEFKVNNVRSGFLSNSSLGLNTFFGYSSGASVVPSAGLNGNWNTGVGYNSLSANTTGHANTALGIGTLRYNTTGIHNVAIGADVLENNLSGIYNVAVGSQSLRANTSGNNNTALGRNTLFSNTIGANNIAIGYNTINNGNNHNNVIAIGTNVNLITNRTNVTVIGNNISDASITQDNMTRIGSNTNALTEVTGQLKINAQSTTNNFTLPTTRGTANQVLSTDGAGATTWVTPSIGGSDTNLYNDNGSLSGNRILTLGGFNLDFAGTGNLGLNDNTLRFRGASDNNHGLQFNTAVDGPSLFGFGGGTLRYGATGGSEALRWSSAGIQINGGSNSYTLPTTRGAANQVLSTDGAGSTQWVTPSAGSSSGSVIVLAANKVGGSSETLPLATSTSPTTIKFNNVVTNVATIGTYNGTTGVFTAAVAGNYLVQVKLLCNDAAVPSQTVGAYLTLLKNNATYGTTGADGYYGDYPTLHNVLGIPGLRGQGSLMKVIPLAAGDTFTIVAVSANSSTASQPTSTVAGSNITIIKL